MGYDRALRGFYLLVERADDADGGFLYCNLDDPTLADCLGLPATLGYFVGKLRALGLPIWQSVLDAVQADRRNQVGNRDVRYDANGQVLG